MQRPVHSPVFLIKSRGGEEAEEEEEEGSEEEDAAVEAEEDKTVASVEVEGGRHFTSPSVTAFD